MWRLLQPANHSDMLCAAGFAETGCKEPCKCKLNAHSSSLQTSVQGDTQKLWQLSAGWIHLQAMS